jgi:hypothetical protein
MKKVIIALCIITMLMLIGCKPREGKTGTDNPFIGGTTGVLISFSQGAPPAEVYSGGDFPFNVFVRLKNDGEYKIPKEKATVKLTGIYPKEFNKEESDLFKTSPEDLEPRSKKDGKITEGSPVGVEFLDLNHKDVLEGNTFTFRADVCYNYQTKAVSKICIRSNNLETKEGVCKVNEPKVSYSSGAPVQISEFREEAQAKNKVGFVFTIQHKGNGLIYKQDSKCAAGMDNKRSFQDKVWVEVNTGISGLKCSGLSDGSDTSGYTTLYDNIKTVSCTQTVDTSSDYEKPVEIKMIYDYEDTAETSVRVKKPAES